MSSNPKDSLVTTYLKSQYLFNHLTTLLTSLPTEKCPSPLSNLEHISNYHKKYTFDNKEPLNQLQIESFVQSKLMYPKWIQKEKQCRNAKYNLQEVCQSWKGVQNLIANAGVCFGVDEGDYIHMALQFVAQKNQARNVRFWGKIMTRENDYYVIQGNCTKQLDLPSVDSQKPAEGINYNTYWVSQDLLSKQWYELPLITPSQLRTARLIKYAFTGDLSASIYSSPPFEGQEKHLLKAQIIRITHNCEVAPKGLYAPKQDNAEQVELAEQFKMVEFGELSNLQNWVHLNPYILQLGRAGYYVDPKLSEEQKEEAINKLGENDPKIERLKAINEDKPVEKIGIEGCWVARVNGDIQQFNNVGKDEGTTSCYASLTLRNPHWPGWTTVANSKQFASIYVGYASKATQPSFHPLAPQDICLQGQDYEEFDEPNPRDPPDELEPDSDDDNKKEEQA